MGTFIYPCDRAKDVVVVAVANPTVQTWRAERNFWISLFAFTLWLLLQRFAAMRKHITELEDKLRALGGGGNNVKVNDKSSGDDGDGADATTEVKKDK